MSLIRTIDLWKIPVGMPVDVHWFGPGPVTVDTGELLYVYCRWAITDDGGYRIYVPQRLGLRCGAVIKHYCNYFCAHEA